jgi:hypothetical protein
MSQAPTFAFSHDELDNVLIQDLTAWSGETEGMDAVESEWISHAKQSHVTASITEFGAEMNLGPETQAHLAREWSENARSAGIDRIAFVSEGIKARAVSANLDVPQDVRTFDSMDAAIEWARE